MLLLGQNAPGIFEVLIQAASQVPALVVLCLVVYTFLKHIKETSSQQAALAEQLEQRMQFRDKHLESLSNACHLSQKDLAESSKEFHKEVMKTTTEALSECRVVIRDNTVALSGIKNELERRTPSPREA